MNRTSLGILALLLFGGGIYLALSPPSAAQSPAGFAAGCIRVGIVLGALWLALPQIMRSLSRTPKWLLVASIIGIVACAVKPLLLIVAIPMLGLLWLLGSKLRTKADKPIIDQRRPRRRSNSR